MIVEQLIIARMNTYAQGSFNWEVCWVRLDRSLSVRMGSTRHFRAQKWGRVQRMRDITIAFIVGTIFFAGGAILTALAIKHATSPGLWDAILWGGIALMVASVLALGIFVSSEQAHRPFWGPAVLGVLGVFALVGALGWHFSKTAHLTVPAEKPVVESPAQPTAPRLSLRQRFDTELAGWRHSADFLVSSTNPQTGQAIWSVSVRRTLHRDALARASYESFYIPMTPYTFEVCKYLAEQWKSIMEESIKETNIIMTIPGETSKIDFSTFTITGQVYVYHESPLTMRELVSLADIFEKNGATVQFRGNP